MRYPAILSERDTLAQVCAGVSLARYGDGEFKLCQGRSAKAQDHDPQLATRLRQILIDPGPALVGVPNLRSPTPKHAFWDPFAVCARLFDPQRRYGSAFVTRPDSAPWINEPAYWAQLETLWRSTDVTLIRGSEKSLVAADLEDAGAVREILAPRRDAWREYAALLERVGTPRRALICLGPTGTVLAADLARRGVHAIDLGHVGLFWRKYRRGEPMVVTSQDRAA